MMDIVKRLRDLSGSEPLADEAADEILRLRRNLDEMYKSYASLRNSYYREERKKHENSDFLNAMIGE